jgi:putative secretion ATPase (PEP-CTERM system associated)
MYERFYNLRERPFSLSPDPDYLYLSRVHREALDSLRYGIESRTGFIVVTGEIGAGKTTLIQALMRRLDERTTAARIVHTTMRPREVLEAVALDFGLDTSVKTKPALLRKLGEFLCEQRASNRRPLLIIDEAQNLSAAGLEEVRLLSNLETEKSKLLQIVIVGQPNLREILAAPELEQFKQRVAVSYHLTSLDSAETAAYIDFRLRHAAIGEPLRFPADAAAVVHRRSAGIPRVINVICDAVFLFGYAEDRHQIDRALIEQTVAELEANDVLPTVRSSEPAPAAVPSSTPVSTSVSVPEVPQGGPAAAARRDLSSAAVGEAAIRSARLDERESRLAQRAMELEEQSRIVADQYRALRSMSAVAAPAMPEPTEPAGGGWFSSIRQKRREVWRRFGPKPSTRAMENN